jgi:hypothetical protein
MLEIEFYRELVEENLFSTVGGRRSVEKDAGKKETMDFVDCDCVQT